MSAATKRLEIDPELCSGFRLRAPHGAREHDQEKIVRKRWISGAIAQLGERLHGMQEVGGSIPPGSTTLRLRLCVAQPRCRKRSVPGVAQRAETGRRLMWYVYIIRSIDSPEQ